MQETKEKELTYEEFINNILETRGRFACGDEYHERHHVLPKCMGGTNDKDNLIDLFAREHFEAHRLLALENPENKKLVYAWWMMSHVKDENQDRYELSADEYEEARKAFSIVRKNIPAYNKGVPASEKQKQKQREKMKGRYLGEKSPWYGRKHSEDTKRKMSENHADFKGENHPQFGTHLSEEHKQKLRLSHLGTKLSDETKKKISESGKKVQGGKNNPMAKSVVQFDLNGNLLQIYEYIKQVEKELHIDPSSIVKCCKHKPKYKTAGGFIWHYLYDQTRKDGTLIPGAITLGLITEEEALAQLTQQND